ncbi:MAG: hypothetical protein SXA11_00490 [Cyanobacteriota bacterium]|nr:hypothetical protein [Cyanobacteriota bacterium]
MAKSKTKKPKATETPSPSKTPKTFVAPNDFYEQKPAWRVSKMVMDGDYGWEILDAEKLIFIKDKLSSFESMTWSEILIKNKKSNHLVKVGDLSKEAQDCLEKMGLDDVDRLLSLRLSGKERVWGILAEGILDLLWWDPQHQVCPSLKKHT